MKHPIYKFLKENNLTQKSEVDFINEYSNPQKSAELYKFFEENNLTSKSEDDFYQEYFSEEKKNFFLDSSKESTGPQKQPTTPSAKPTPKAPLPSTSIELLYTGALGGLKRNEPIAGVGKPLKQKQEPIDVTYTPEEMPSETTERAIPQRIRQFSQRAKEAEKQISEGQLPTDPQFVNEGTISKVEENRKKLGLSTLDESFESAAKQRKEAEKFDKYEYDSRDINSLEKIFGKSKDEVVYNLENLKFTPEWGPLYEKYTKGLETIVPGWDPNSGLGGIASSGLRSKAKDFIYQNYLNDYNILKNDVDSQGIKIKNDISTKISDYFAKNDPSQYMKDAETLSAVKLRPDDVLPFGISSVKTGEKVVDMDKVNKLAEEMMSKSGQSTDFGYVRDLIIDAIKTDVNQEIIKPEAEKLLKGERAWATSQPLKEIITSPSFIYNEAKKEYQEATGKAWDENKQNVDITAKTRLKLDSEYKNIEQSAKAEQDALLKEYERLVELAKQQGTEAPNPDIINEKIAQINTKYEQRWQRSQDAILEKANIELEAAYKKFTEGLNIDPSIQQKFEKAYSLAYSEAAKNRDKRLDVAVAEKGLPMAQFARTYMTALGGSLKGYGAAFDNQTLKDFGNALEQNFYLAPAEIDGWNSLLEGEGILGNFQKLNGMLAGSMTTSLTASTLAAATTGGTGVLPVISASIAGFLTESAEMAGRAKQEMFLKTGSISRANKAYEDTWRAQYNIAGLYAFEGLPFIGKAIRGIGSRGLRIGLGAGVEYVTEVPQEFTQGIYEENIAAGLDPWDSFYEKTNPFGDSEAAKIARKRHEENFITLTPTLIYGGAGQIRSTSEKTDAINAYAAMTAKEDMASQLPDLKSQWLQNLYQSKGGKFTSGVLASMHQAGQITTEQFGELNIELERVKNTIETARENGITKKGDVNLFSFLSRQSKTARQNAEKYANSNPGLSKFWEEKAKEYDQQSADFLNGKTPNVFTVTFADGSQSILSEYEAKMMAKSDSFLGALENGSARIESYRNDQKEFMDGLRSSVDSRRQNISNLTQGIVSEVGVSDASKVEKMVMSHPNYNSMTPGQKASLSFKLKELATLVEQAKSEPKAGQEQNIERVKKELADILDYKKTPKSQKETIAQANKFDRELYVLNEKKNKFFSPRISQLMNENKMSRADAAAQAETEWRQTEDGKRELALQEERKKLDAVARGYVLQDPSSVPLEITTSEIIEKPTDDKKDQTGLPSQVGEGQKPIETQPIQGAGAETTETSGVLQAPEEVTPTTEAAPEEVTPQAGSVVGGEVEGTFENREAIEDNLKDLGDNVYYHGSDDISYLNSKEDLNTAENTKNAESKYLNLNPKASVAISYSIRQQKIGEKSGVAAFKLKGKGYTMKDADIKTLKSNADYEAFYDKKKSEGYDYVKVPQDANDIVVLNNNAIEYVGKKFNKEAVDQSLQATPQATTVSEVVEEKPAPKPQTTEETTQAQMEFPEPTERNDENINALLEKKRKYNSLPKKSKPLATNLLNEIRSMAKDMGIEVTFAAGFEIRLTDKKTGKNITKRGVDRTVNKDRNQVRQAALSAAGDGMLGMYARVMLWFRSGGKILTSQSELGENTREMKDAKKRGYIGDDGASAEMAAEQLVEDVLGVDPERASEYVYDNDIVSLFQDFLAEYGSSSKEDIENGIIDIYLRNAEEQNEEAKGRFEMEYGKGALGFLNQDIKLEEIESKIQEETPRPKSTQWMDDDYEFSPGGREPDFRRVKGPTERGEAVSGAEAVKMVENFLKASGINVRVLNDKDFDALLGKKGYSVDADGVFMTNDNTGEVLIRRSGLESKYGDVIVFHEGIHPVINIIRNTDPKLYNAIVQGIKNEAKTNKKIQGIISEVERVMEGEPAPAIEDEIVTEVFSRIASGDVKLSEIKKSLAEKIIYYANKIAKLLGLNKRIGINPSDIEFRDFANDLTNALRQGGSITDVVGRGKEKEFINEKTKDGRTITTNQEGSFISESGNVQYSRRGAVRGEKDKGGSADTTVKNVWNQYKGIKFNGSLKIEDASDVAHIMRQLENKAVEHAFAVHVDKNGKPHIQFLGMGGVASTIVDRTLVLAGAKRYNSKKIYLVHNHPSGSMTPSSHDISLTNDIREMFVGLKIPIEHVILDTYKKEFVHIDISGYSSVESRDERKEADEKYLRSLKTEMMDEFEVLSAPLAKVTSSRDTAQFFTQMRFTALPKNGMLVMDRQNHVIGNYILPGGFNYKDVTDNMVGAGVGQGVIFYSNQDNYKDIDSIKKGLEAAGISVFDYILVDSNSQSVNDFYKSYADEGLLRETQQEYGTTPVEKQKAQFSRKMDRDMAVTPSGETVKTKPLPEGLAIINGFYSPIEKNLMEYGKDKIKAKDWLNVVGKGDEAVFTGVRAFLEGKDPNAMVSKQEILDWMKNNRIQIDVISKTGEAKDLVERADEAERIFGVQVNLEENPMDESAVVVEISGDKLDSMTDEEYEDLKSQVTNYVMADNKKTIETKHSPYQLEGDKENYKEVLVTLPRKLKSENKTVYKVFNKDTGDLIGEYGGRFVAENIAKRENGRVEEQIVEEIGYTESGFKSSHFDEPNILVHLRMNTRTDADGKKVLFLEEIQSDWGQLGKKEGFAKSEKEIKDEYEKADKAYDIYLNEIETKYGKNFVIEDLSKSEYDKYAELANKRANLGLQIDSGRIQGQPTAPFVMDTNAWTKLGLKVALKEAVKQGVDKIAWTTGEQQNDRYDLSKQVKKIEWRRDGDSYTLNITGIDNNTGRPESTLKAKDLKELEGIVGKEIAQKIFDESEKKNKKVKIESKVFQEGSWRKAWSYETPSGYIRKAKEDTKESAIEGAKEAWGATSSSGVVEGEGLKVGGKGMKGFYGSMEEGTKGIVGGVAEKLSGQELGETKIDANERGKATKDFDNLKESLQFEKQLSEKGKTGIVSIVNKDGSYTIEWNEKKLSTQPSIDITPEIKAEVLQGQAQFSRKMSRDLSEEERNQSLEGVKTEMARIEDSISDGADPQTAYDELFATQDYADISMDLRMKVNAAIKRAYPNVTTAENIARGLTESYEKKEAKVADVLRNDRDLAYIYRNFPSIIDQLKENKVIEIEGDCV